MAGDTNSDMKDNINDTKNRDVRDTEVPKWKWGKKDLRPKFIKMNKYKSPKKKH